MKCLVTGGAGFIGSHLCDTLIAQGNDVVCVDNLITGSRNNIVHLLKKRQFTFLESDCTHPLPKELHCQAVFHFASPASPPKYQQFPLETLLVNTIATYQLLELSARWHARFIFASTSEVYGDPHEHPQKETYWGNVNSFGPRACYDEAKRAGEAFVFTYIKKYQLDARVIRIFNTYGPRMDLHDGRVVTNFIGQLLYGKPVTIYGDGRQTRSFCYVSDLVSGIMAVFTKDIVRGEVINLGNPNEISMRELAETIAKLQSLPLKVENHELPEDDPVRRQPDISKARKLLGWEPRISLSEGLRQTINYFQKGTP